jgi:DNA polymerase-3 subunit alpha
MFPINEVKEHVITELNQIFSENKGDNSVTFEVMELDRIKKALEEIPVVAPLDIEEDIVNESGEVAEMEIEVPVEKEEIIVKTKLSMPSRKLKVKISSELLQELERLQVNFKLN